MSKSVDSTKQITAKVIDIPVDLIKLDPSLNGRYSQATDVNDLANSIGTNGQQQPVEVRPDPDQPGKYLLNFGTNRVTAIAAWNKAHPDNQLYVKAIVRKCASPLEAFERNLEENLRRKSLTPMDFAFSIQRLRELGASEASISQRMGKSPAWVRQHEKLLALPAKVKGYIHNGLIPADAAFLITDLNTSERDGVVEASLAAAKETKRKEVEKLKELEAALAASQAAAKEEAKEEAKEADGSGNTKKPKKAKAVVTPTAVAKQKAKAEQPVKVTKEQVLEKARAAGALAKPVARKLTDFRDILEFLKAPSGEESDGFFRALSKSTMDYLDGINTDDEYVARLKTLYEETKGGVGGPKPKAAPKAKKADSAD